MGNTNTNKITRRNKYVIVLITGASSGEIKDAIAIADHALDVHGKDGMCRELDVPYGIPIECTMTKEYDNLFVACRGASFSHIASSSIRLTRTMLQLGEGVGKYLVKKISGTEE